jgi:hypothetical protein
MWGSNLSTPVTIRRATVTYDAAAGATTRTLVDYPARAIIFPSDDGTAEQVMEGDAEKGGRRLMFAAADTSGIAPAPVTTLASGATQQDYVLLGTEEFKVYSVSPAYVGGTVVAYTVRVRK